MALAIGHGGNGGAVAQVGNHHAQIFFVFAEEAGGFIGHKAIARAMCTVAAQAVFAVELARNGIGVGMLGHGLVESGVEHGHVGQAAKHFHGGADAQKVGRIVQGR